jgi:excisionase family DNA binding protein
MDGQSLSEPVLLPTSQASTEPGVFRIALNIDEAASALGVTRRTIEGMIDRGELRAKLVGRRLLIGVDQLRKYFR